MIIFAAFLPEYGSDKSQILLNDMVKLVQCQFGGG